MPTTVVILFVFSHLLKATPHNSNKIQYNTTTTTTTAIPTLLQCFQCLVQVVQYCCRIVFYLRNFLFLFLFSPFWYSLKTSTCCCYCCCCLCFVLKHNLLYFPSYHCFLFMFLSDRTLSLSLFHSLSFGLMRYECVLWQSTLSHYPLALFGLECDCFFVHYLRFISILLTIHGDKAERNGLYTNILVL